MDATLMLVLIAVAWVLIGAVVALVMGRRGFHAWSWLVAGVVLGPLSVPLAVSATRRTPPTLFRAVSEGMAGPGEVDVLVGVDGSDESRVALTSALDLLGTRIGRLTLAAVVDRDTAETPGLWEDEARAAACLEEMSGAVTTPRPGTVLLEGSAAQALMGYASSEGYEMVAVGHRGRGASIAVLGSVATRLAKDPSVPVLIA
jgi:nucleotide-binding universal stress UspA family protein